MDEKQKTDQPENTIHDPGQDATATQNTVPVDEPAYPRREGGGGMKPAAVAALCVVLVLITALISAGVWRDDAQWVAKVNGEKVTQAELYDEMYANMGPDSLQNLITEKLIAQEAKAQDISVSDEELDERMNKLINQQFGSEEQFEQLLAMYNMSRADFEEQMRNQITVGKILEPSIDLKDEELKTYFEENREVFNTPRTAEIRHILSETRAEAEEVRAEIAGGADFTEIAKERSADQTTAPNGGEMGPISYSEELPSWLLSAFELSPGELSAVVEGEDGFHVIEVTDLTPAVEPEFEEVKDEVRQMVLEEKMMTIYPEWLNNLLENANIEYQEQ